MMPPKLIVIWGCENVASSYIQRSLASQPDWKVIHISDIEELDAQIMALGLSEPEIILIGQGNYNQPPNLLPKVVQNHSNFKVIIFSFENNMLEVYSKQEKLFQQASDLISVIENPPAAPGDTLH